MRPTDARTGQNSKQAREGEGKGEGEGDREKGQGWPTTRSLICITGRAVDGFGRIQRKGGERERGIERGGRCQRQQPSTVCRATQLQAEMSF